MRLRRQQPDRDARRRCRFGAGTLALLLATGALALGACSGPARAPGSPAAPNPTASTAPGTQASSAQPPKAGATEPSEIPEPTTTNTLPPPAAPTKAAPSTAGGLDASSLPVPAGWKTIAREGGEEEGYLGNGTWVHERDPRYAAFDVITIGCAAVTRDDYTDPTAALEGTYQRKGEPGIGLVLEFATPAQAAAYFDLYQRQVTACQGDDAPVQITRVDNPTGLIDRRAYPDGDWTEVGNVSDRRVTLIILSDPGMRISARDARTLLTQIG